MPLQSTTKLTDYLKSQNRGTNPNDLRKLYGGMDLEKRYGSYNATGQQHQAMYNLLQLEAGVKSAQTKMSGLQSMVQQGLKLKEAGVDIKSETQFAPTPEYAKAYPDFSEVKEGAYRFNPDTGKAEQYIGGEWKPQDLSKPNGGGEGGEGQTVYSPPLEANSLADLIDKISSGEYPIPEMEIYQEATELAKEGEKERAAEALEKTQQALASKGMAFSGVRTAEEEDLAAEHLRKMAGISQGLAMKIIQAARAEQQRLKPTYRSVGGALYEIRPGEEPKKIIDAPADQVTYQGQVFEKDPETGEWKATLTAPQRETKPVSYREWQLAGGEEGTGLSFFEWLEREEGEQPINIGAQFGLTGSTATQFSNDVEQQIQRVYSGAYGTEWARDKAFNVLVAKYPNLESQLKNYIYNQVFPDGYESLIDVVTNPYSDEEIIGP